MQITQLLEGETLLTYSLSTAPVPLQVSPASGPPAVASLMIVISAPKDPGDVTVTEVVFKLPVGNPQAPDSSDLTESAGSIDPSVAASDAGGWTITRGTIDGVFLLKPKTGSTGVISQQGIAVTLNGISVSPVVGTATVKIIETASAADRPAQPRQCLIAVPKFPAGFFAGNFTAEKPMVANGESAVLTWSGSAEGIYTILWATHSRVVSDLRRWVSPPLTEATTFILQVSPQQGGETVVAYFSATVMVLDPSLVANDLTVLKAARLQGPVTASDALAVQGLSTLASASVAGTADVARLVSHALDAQGNSTIANASITNLTVATGFTAQGWVSLLPGATEVDVGTHVAATDGFVVGWVGGGGADPSKKSWMVITAQGRFGYVEAVGGNVVLSLAAPGWYGPNSGSFLLPVRRGDSFWLNRREWDQNQVTPLSAFYWFPLGTPPAPARAARKKTSARSPRQNTSVPRAATQPKTKAPPAGAREISAFAAALEDAIGTRLPGAKRAKLKKAIGALLETGSAARTKK